MSYISRTAAAATALLCLAGLLVGCEDNGVLATPNSDIRISASPETVVIDVAGGATSGESTITAQLFDEAGFTQQGVSTFFSSTGGILHTDCSGTVCTVSGAQCAVSSDCTLASTQAIETDANGFAVVGLTARTIDADPITVTVSSGSQSEMTDVSILEDAGNLPPTAVIDIDPPSGELVGFPVTFDGTASDDPDGVITCYQWEITSSEPGDSEIVQGTGATLFSRTYTVEQTLSVILRVSDDPAVGSQCQPVPPGSPANSNLFNGTDSESYAIVCDFTPPVADAGLPQILTLSGASVSANLSGAGSSDPESMIVEYRWDCRNGEILFGQNVTCTYTQIGPNDVNLTVTNGCGQTDTDAVRITVNSP